ncbi:MAG TPA: universal stress protein [Ilumatobacteraceae bacterium]|nr:universal stress protein [Ilumatobacteraceae bacterium]
MTRVLIAVDGSDLDKRLAEEAHRLFGADAEYWAVNVHNPRDPSMPGGAAAVPGAYGAMGVGYGVAYPYVTPSPHEVAPGAAVGTDVRNPEQERRRVAETAVTHAGLDDAAVVTEAGEPSATILRAADHHGADVIVIGSHERSWWKKLIDPSVSGDIVEESRVPVLVVREHS